MSFDLDDSIGFEEPGNESPAVTAKKDRNALAITADLDRVNTALNEFDRVSAGLADLEARYPKDVVYAVETAKGYKDAIEHRAAWRDPRILVEKSRKMAKAPILTLGKSIDARAAWLTEKLEEGEKPVDQQIKAEDARREEVKQARINAEAGRIIAIQEALAEIGQNVLIACGKTSSEVRALSVQMHETRPDPEVFQEMIGQAKEAWAAGIAKLETSLKAKLWDEAEQARIAEERAAEEERRKQADAAIEAQRLENERIAAEQKAEADRLAAERAEFERQKAELAAQQKVIDDAKAEADRKEREAQETAQRELDAIESDQRAAAAAADQRAAADAIEAAAAEKRETIQVITSAEVADLAARILPAAASKAIHPAAQALRNEAPTLTLEAMKDRLGFALTADFLTELGFEATPVKAARLYRESQFGDICNALIRHIECAAAEVALAA